MYFIHSQQLKSNFLILVAFMAIKKRSEFNLIEKILQYESKVTSE